MQRSAAPGGLRVFGVIAAFAGVIAGFPLLRGGIVGLAMAYALGGVASCVSLFAFARVIELLESINERVAKLAGERESGDPVRDEARAAGGLK